MLSADTARCPGVNVDGQWREGCEDCQRLEGAAEYQSWTITPPAIIVFECEFRIAPEDAA